MIGEFGYEIEDSPYILEAIISNFDPEENLQVSHALLTSSVKLFLIRPAEMHNTLSLLFKTIFTDSVNPDLHDRAGFYYKLLENDPEIAYQIINSEKFPISIFNEDDKSHTVEKLCQEFNSLSVIYQKPSHKQLKVRQDIAEMNGNGQLVPYEGNNEADLLSLEVNEDSDMLQLKEEFELQPTPLLTSEQYQEFWMNLAEDHIEKLTLTRLATIEQVEELFLDNSVVCIASGNQDGILKFYFYAKENKTGNAFLVELVMTPTIAEISYTVKSQDPAQTQEFLGVFYQILSPLIT